MDLPVFRFHPDPIRSGSVEASTTKCRCCRRARGYIYTGPVYSDKELDDCLCPWCIADGSAHKKYDAIFIDDEGVDDGVPEESLSELVERTPGFNAWQQEKWPVCCGEPTQFIEPLGISEIRARCRDVEGMALNYIIYDLGISGGAATRMVNALDRNNSPTAFLFRCAKCETPRVYVDSL